MNSSFRLLSKIKPYWKWVLLAILSNILMAVFTVVSIPALIPFFDILFDTKEIAVNKPVEALNFSNALEYGKYTVSNMITTLGKEATLIRICLFVVLLFFFKNAFRYLALFFMAPVRNGIVRDIRDQLMGKLVSLPLSFYSEEKKGDIISRVSGDVQEIEWSILNVLETIFKEPLIILGSIAFMLYISPQLTMFVIVLILFTALIIGWISKTLKKKSLHAQTRLGQLISILEETISGLRIVKAFNAEPYVLQSFAKENEKYKNLLTRILWRRDLSSPLSEFLGICVVAVLMWYGSRLVFYQSLDPGTFFAFVFAFYNVINPAKSFSQAYYYVQKGLAALDRVDEIMDAEDSIIEHRRARPLLKFEENIQFEQVSFRYQEGSELVLDGINVSLAKTTTLALVGASGAGKSTLVDLIPRFYDPTEGRILIDGIDLRELKIKDLRNLISIVSQEPILFNDTVEKNISFGLPLDSERLLKAVKMAHADVFIDNLEQGLNTVIGDRGNKLSGGQRQRLTLARAIYKDTPIIILDEATSALDSESEKWVQAAMDEIMKEKTVIVIAHRLSTIQHADQILVMKSGKIIQRGTHSELISVKGEYKKFVSLQAF